MKINHSYMALALVLTAFLMLSCEDPDPIVNKHPPQPPVEEPTDPENPENPEEPAEPDTPTDPEEPETPTTPEEPEVPEDLPELDQYVGLPTPLAEAVYTPSLHSIKYKPIQVKRTSSNNRPVTSWTTEKTRILPYLVGFTRNENLETYKSKTNKFGSSTELPRQAATGRFYVTKIGQRWWIVDPEGYLHYERSVCSFRKGGSDRNAKAFAQRFSSDADWVATTQRELADIGFHGTGAFSTNKRSSDITGYQAVQDHNAAYPDAPLTLAPSFGFLSSFKNTAGGYPGGDSDCAACLALHEKWPNWCKDYVKSSKGVGPYLHDPYVLGIFSDNEINFASGSGTKHLLVRVLNTGDTDNAVYKATIAWCSANGVSTSSPTTAQCNAFAGYVAEKYYKGVKEALLEADPKMLYLGTRLHGTPKYIDEIITAAGKWCDIVSINYYSRWSPELSDYIPKWGTLANKPFLVTEFYTKGNDSDLDNTSGAGFLVPTQRDRAYAYQHFTLGLLEAPNCVGWHWFKYQDDDGSDNSNKPANKGLYDNYYQIIPDMGMYAKDVNIHAYDLIEFFDSY